MFSTLYWLLFNIFFHVLNTYSLYCQHIFYSCYLFINTFINTFFKLSLLYPHASVTVQSSSSFFTIYIMWKLYRGVCQGVLWASMPTPPVCRPSWATASGYVSVKAYSAVPTVHFYRQFCLSVVLFLLQPQVCSAGRLLDNKSCRLRNNCCLCLFPPWPSAYSRPVCRFCNLFKKHRFVYQQQ